MRRLLAMMLILSSCAAIADDQGEYESKKKPKYKLGEAVIFKIDPFYSKACRNKKIPGMDTLIKEDESVGIIDQFYDGKYRIVKVHCDSERLYGYHHFNANEADIVARYVKPESKDEGTSWWWWILGLGGLAVGVPLIL